MPHHIHSPEAVRRILELRSKGLSFAEIGRALEKNEATVRSSFYRHRHILGVEAGNALLRRSTAPLKPLERQRAVTAYLQHLGESTTGWGAVAKTARALSVNPGSVYMHLIRSGIVPSMEAHRKKIELSLKVAQTMNLPRRDVQKYLGIASGVLNRYRARVNRGLHMSGALVLVESPESHEWWDIKLPPVISGSGGAARIDLKVRNETVLHDLELLNRAIRTARDEMVKLHPDIPENRGDLKKAELFHKANTMRMRLIRALQKYRQREIGFRKKYGLPIHEALKKG